MVHLPIVSPVICPALCHLNFLMVKVASATLVFSLNFLFIPYLVSWCQACFSPFCLGLFFLVGELKTRSGSHKLGRVKCMHPRFFLMNVGIFSFIMKFNDQYFYQACVILRCIIFFSFTFYHQTTPVTRGKLHLLHILFSSVRLLLVFRCSLWLPESLSSWIRALFLNFVAEGHLA